MELPLQITFDNMPHSDAVTAKVREQGIVHALPEIVTYGITADEAHRFGLPCGGTLQLVIEPLRA